MDQSSVKEMAQVVTIVDVYDSAALIGKDFEFIIEQYGVEAVTELMPKVIRVLEQLEYLANQYEQENEEITELENTIEQLNLDKEERQKERLQYEQELEQVEESWQKESQELMAQVTRLQEHNKQLQESLTDKFQGQQAAVDNREEELELIKSLRIQVTDQRNQLKILQKDIKLKQFDADALRSHTQLLENENEVLIEASQRTHSQTQELISQCSSLQSSVQQKDIRIQTFICSQKETKQENFQIQVNQLENRVRENRLLAHIRTSQAKQMISDKSDLQTDILNLTQQIKALTQEKDSIDGTDGTDLVQRMIADKDQETPRFTLTELRDVLTERNYLKSKLIEVEEELSFYKNREHELSGADNLESESSRVEDEENFVGPVQGPINQEPWDKLHDVRQPSGIRKFFERFPVELPETIRVNLVSGDLGVKASSFWDLRMSPVRRKQERKPSERPKSEHASTYSIARE